MKHHDLKILPRYYKAVSDGLKTYEVRLNDRNFEEGDTVTLKEYDKEKEEYTGCQLDFKIGTVVHLKYFFHNDNKYVIFSLVADVTPYEKAHVIRYESYLKALAKIAELEKEIVELSEQANDDFNKFIKEQCRTTQLESALKERIICPSCNDQFNIDEVLRAK